MTDAIKALGNLEPVLNAVASTVDVQDWGHGVRRCYSTNKLLTEFMEEANVEFSQVHAALDKWRVVDCDCSKHGRGRRALKCDAIKSSRLFLLPRQESRIKLVTMTTYIMRGKILGFPPL